MLRIIFTGPRNLSDEWQKTVDRVIDDVQAKNDKLAATGPFYYIGVGDADGLDAMVRKSAKLFTPFSVEGVRTSLSLVRRSMDMVAWGSGGDNKGVCLGFVNVPCPVGIAPAKTWSSPQYGKGSGTWSTLALAVGYGMKVFVRRCGIKETEMPSWPGGKWVKAGNGIWVDWLLWGEGL